MELRCPSRINGILDQGRLEVKCSSKHCGSGSGVSVFHYFDINTGELTETRRFKDPVQKKEQAHASGNPTSLRSA